MAMHRWQGTSMQMVVFATAGACYASLVCFLPIEHLLLTSFLFFPDPLSVSSSSSAFLFFPFAFSVFLRFFSASYILSPRRASPSFDSPPPSAPTPPQRAAQPPTQPPAPRPLASASPLPPSIIVVPVLLDPLAGLTQKGPCCCCCCCCCFDSGSCCGTKETNNSHLPL